MQSPDNQDQDLGLTGEKPKKEKAVSSEGSSYQHPKHKLQRQVKIFFFLWIMHPKSNPLLNIGKTFNTNPDRCLRKPACSYPEKSLNKGPIQTFSRTLLVYNQDNPFSRKCSFMATIFKKR